MAKEPISPKAEKSAAAEKVDVVLIAEHEHGGELKQSGDSISVTQSQHEWLRKHGKIE